jgi:hypothetical protein
LERIEAYQQKIQRLRDFQRNRGLERSELSRRTNRAADEILRIIGGLELLMEQEAQQIFDQAMKADPEERDRLLNQLKNIPYPELQVRSRAEEELNQRTVGGELYPSVEEAREAQKKLDVEERQRREELEQKDLEDIESLKQELLSDPISQAAETYAEMQARQMLEAALRVVLPQRRERLKEITRRYPGTEAATEANSILNHLQQQNQLIASRKLHEALGAPVIYDQRWRRLKELEREYPNTSAAAEAGDIFERHLALVPPVVISNHFTGPAEFTIDKPYSVMEQVTLPAGESRTFSTAFPVMIRVRIKDSEWDIYRVWPGGNLVLQTAQGVPMLCPVP